jgi:hypothetical protein
MDTQEFNNLTRGISRLKPVQRAVLCDLLEEEQGGVLLAIPNASTQLCEMIAKPGLEEAIARVGMEDALTAINEWEGRRNG